MKTEIGKKENCRKGMKILLFFCCFLLTVFVSMFYVQLNINENIAVSKTIKATVKKAVKKNEFQFIIYISGKVYVFNENEINLSLSKYQKQMRNGDVFKAVLFLQNFGLSQKESMKYILPELEIILNRLKTNYEKQAIEEKVEVVKNSCEIYLIDGKNGIFINEEKFYNDAFLCLKNGKKSLSIKVACEKFDLPKIDKNLIREKSCFSTNFETSSDERKNNIKVALSKFDGLILENGETLSFNMMTGIRNAEAGYKPAKIISGGTFVNGFGGGVCQVSTTLYNACLLAGLEILEVHNHSLPVSYIEPSFDAMVNSGSSDLVVRNNSGERLIITTSSKGDICKVKIFGKPNDFKITRISEKTKVIPAGNEEVITDAKKAEEFGVLAGETKRISYAKDGFSSNGYLNYYDKNGNLVKTKKIRSNTYNPTRGVVVKNIV